MKLTKNIRLQVTAMVTLFIWSHILWDYFHGGIPIHYLFHDPDLPGIPNWVGGCILPFFTWFLLHRIHKRREASDAKESIRLIIYRFLVALSIAVFISVCFTSGIDAIDYIMLGIMILAFVFPLYKAEYLLGWVLGSALTFGAVIPMVFGSVLALIFWFFYKIGRGVLGVLRPKKW